MEEQPIAELVEATFVERDLEFERYSDHFRLPHGSALVIVEVDDLGGGSVVRVCALVLDEIAIKPGYDTKALRAVNDRNRHLRFGKFTWHPESREIRLEHDLLGDWLQAEELMNAVTSVAQMADDHDDLLREELGSGRRAADR